MFVKIICYNYSSAYIDSNTLVAFLEREQMKGGTAIIPIKVELSNTISEVKDSISTETGINIDKLHLWGIQYDDKQYNLKINDKKRLEHYIKDDKKIHRILVKEESTSGRSFIPEGFTNVISKKNPV